MSVADALGDRMKGYEDATAGPRLDTSLPIYARIDGRSFSKFTRGLERPYDARLSRAMIQTTCALVEKMHATLGYTQSDEISLAFISSGPDSDTIFNGRTQKLVSVLASFATIAFVTELDHLGLTNYLDREPHFDCRVCQMPSIAETENMFLWRWKDATKNAIQMVAQAKFSAKQLHAKHGGEMVEMLRAEGIEFDALPAFFRRGTFAKRVTESRELTPEELARIPEAHRPTGPVQRHRIATFEIEDLFADRERIFAPAPTVNESE
jgi:tRNA(His) guanylyltransferase